MDWNSWKAKLSELIVRELVGLVDPREFDEEGDIDTFDEVASAVTSRFFSENNGFV